MSGHGAPDCPICGAHTDYCHLTTVTGIEIDCRDLKLRDPEDLKWNIALAAEMQKVHTEYQIGNHRDESDTNV